MKKLDTNALKHCLREEIKELLHKERLTVFEYKKIQTYSATLQFLK